MLIKMTDTDYTTLKHGASCCARRYPVTESDQSQVSGNSTRTLDGSFELPPLDDTSDKSVSYWNKALTYINTDVNAQNHQQTIKVNHNRSKTLHEYSTAATGKPWIAE